MTDNKIAEVCFNSCSIILWNLENEKKNITLAEQNVLSLCKWNQK